MGRLWFESHNLPYSLYLFEETLFTPCSKGGVCLKTHSLFVSLMYCVQAQKKENLWRFSFMLSVELKATVTAYITVIPEPDLTGITFRAMFHKHLHWCWQFGQ